MVAIQEFCSSSCGSHFENPKVWQVQKCWKPHLWLKVAFKALLCSAKFRLKSRHPDHRKYISFHCEGFLVPHPEGVPCLPLHRMPKHHRTPNFLSPGKTCQSVSKGHFPDLLDRGFFSCAYPLLTLIGKVLGGLWALDTLCILIINIHHEVWFAELLLFKGHYIHLEPTLELLPHGPLRHQDVVKLQLTAWLLNLPS